MYTFSDTIKNESVTSRPAEAMRINGVYLEDVIPGYRTISVSGRESIPVAMSVLETQRTDGGVFRRKRRKPRIITVSYLLQAASSAAFRSSYNLLNKYLDQNEAKFIFDDESDKFFVGTVDAMGEVPAGRNYVRAEFEIYCSDPFKYSVTEYEAEASSGEIAVDYNGTYPAHPVLEATCKSTLGYVGYIDSAEHILQIGNPDQMGEEQEASSQLINASFASGVPTGWTTNNAYTPTTTGRKVHYHTGSVAKFGGGFDGGVDAGVGSHVNTANYGTGAEWHGPTLTKTFTASKNFKMEWHHWLQYNTANCVGTFVASVDATVNGTKQNVAAIWYIKDQKGTANGRIELVVKDAIKETINFPVTIVNPYTGERGTHTVYGTTYVQTNSAVGTSSISKFGSRIRFNIAGTIKEFTVSDVENVEATEISFWFEKYGTENDIGGNILNTATLTRFSDSATSEDYATTQFYSGDVVTADCGSAKIDVNGVPKYGLGALGNSWDGFVLNPGANVISCNYSSWGTSPTFKMRYREVFL